MSAWRECLIYDDVDCEDRMVRGILQERYKLGLVYTPLWLSVMRGTFRENNEEIPF